MFWNTSHDSVTMDTLELLLATAPLGFPIGNETITMKIIFSTELDLFPPPPLLLVNKITEIIKPAVILQVFYSFMTVPEGISASGETELGYGADP